MYLSATQEKSTQVVFNTQMCFEGTFLMKLPIAEVASKCGFFQTLEIQMPLQSTLPQIRL